MRFKAVPSLCVHTSQRGYIETNASLSLSLTQAFNKNFHAIIISSSKHFHLVTKKHLLGNLEEMFPLRYIDSEMFGMFKSSTNLKELSHTHLAVCDQIGAVEDRTIII